MIAAAHSKSLGEMDTVATKDVVLVNMPFTNSDSPSIGLGLLKASLTRIGVSTKCLDLHLRFAELIGEDTYKAIEGKTYPEHLVGEWIFSSALFDGKNNEDFHKYFTEVLDINTVDVPDQPVYTHSFLEQLKVAILIAKAHVDGFLDECTQRVLRHRPKLVGFTSMFQQQVASLALAKRIKSRDPACTIVFGGSNCEGLMGAEIFRQFEFIDVLVSGEGDLVFPEIVRSVFASTTIPLMPGVFNRRRPALPTVNQSPLNTPLVEDLDQLPLPDYDDYFEELGRRSLKPSRKPILLFETSRGCWWGEKQHCTFCGLNGATMTYRSKSADRALHELQYLQTRYPGCGFNAVDNILEMKYFKTFLKALAEGQYNFGLFYEVKANLKKEQLKLLKQAGVDTIQPGIESLSDNVLRIMRKGVSALQNIQLLKWCTELNIKVIYNIIWGFPGETSEDYKKTIELIPLLTHLRPPVGAGTIRIDRFSPNFTQHRELGFGDLVPFPAYSFVYALEPEAVRNLAYYFVPEYENGQLQTFDTPGLTFAVKKWKETYTKSELFFMDQRSGLLIWDLRPDAKEPLILLDENARLAYLACDESRTLSQIYDFCRQESPQQPVDKVRLKDTLDSFVGQSLMIESDGRYLALAYPKTCGRSTEIEALNQ